MEPTQGGRQALRTATAPDTSPAGEPSQMRVLIVDDHVMVLEGLKGLIEALDPGLSVKVARNSPEMLTLVRETPFDLIILDWNLEECSGDAAIAELRQQGCLARVVVLSGTSDPSLVTQALDAGAYGFIPKRYDSGAMLAALRVVLQGRIFVPGSTQALKDGARRVDSADPSSLKVRLESLTPKQFEVYRHMARGLPNKLIARTLDISEETVKSHLSRVYDVLGVRNRTEAAYQISREGIQLG
jgi:DNA-binding NarL/FixJ family response regulator